MFGSLPARLATTRPGWVVLGYGCGCGCRCDLAKPYLFGERCLLAVYIFSDLKRCRFATSIGYHWTPNAVVLELNGRLLHTDATVSVCLEQNRQA